MAELNFDVTETPIDDGYDPVPSGIYNVIVTKTELHDTQAGGQRLSCILKIMEGELQNKAIFLNFNTINHNEVAQRIGRSKLHSITKAVGLEKIRNTEQLHNIPFQANIVYKSNEGTKYDPSNELKSAKPIGQGQQATGQQPQAATQQAPVQSQQPAAQPETQWSKPNGAGSNTQPQWGQQSGQESATPPWANQ